MVETRKLLGVYDNTKMRFLKFVLQLAKAATTDFWLED